MKAERILSIHKKTALASSLFIMPFPLTSTYASCSIFERLYYSFLLTQDIPVYLNCIILKIFAKRFLVYNYSLFLFLLLLLIIIYVQLPPQKCSEFE